MNADPPAARSGARAGELPSGTITREGLGGERVLALLRDEVLPSCTAIDHRRYLAFIPNARRRLPRCRPAGQRLRALRRLAGSRASGAVQAENEALRWLADLAGLPETAGGTFVQGGTNGNLSALHAARERARHGGAHGHARAR